MYKGVVMKILLCWLIAFSVIFPEIAVSKVNGRDRNRTALSKRMVREGSKDLKGGELSFEKVGSVFKKVNKDSLPPTNPQPQPTPDPQPQPDPNPQPNLPTPSPNPNPQPDPSNPTVPLVPLTPAESIELAKLDDELSAVVKSAGEKVAIVKSACVGISEKLDTINKLSLATAGLSAGTTAIAGGALIAGAVKSNKKNVANALVGAGVDDDNVKKNQDSAKSANNWRTGLVTVATATSAAATGTAGASVYQAKDLPDIIKKCNDAIASVKVENSKLKTMIEDAKYTVIKIAENKKFSNSKKVVDNIKMAESKLKIGEDLNENCKQYDTSSVNFVKGLSISSTALSGVGTATGLIGAFTSGFAKQGAKNEKALDITSNIMTGITTGTGATTIATSSDTARRVKDLKEKSDKCESFLNGLN